MTVPLLALTLAGAMTLISGAQMAIGAVVTYETMFPQTSLFLVVYLPLAAVLMALGSYWLILAQRRYEAGRPTQTPLRG